MTVPKLPYDFHSRLDEVGRRQGTVHTAVVRIHREGKSLYLENPNPTGIEVEALNEHGLLEIQQFLQDFIFDTASLRDWMPNVPQRGDLLSWRGDLYQTFSIGREYFTFTTSSRRRCRVHTKRVTGQDPLDVEE